MMKNYEIETDNKHYESNMPFALQIVIAKCKRQESTSGNALYKAIETDIRAGYYGQKKAHTKDVWDFGCDFSLGADLIQAVNEGLSTLVKNGNIMAISRRDIFRFCYTFCDTVINDYIRGGKTGTRQTESKKIIDTKYTLMDKASLGDIDTLLDNIKARKEHIEIYKAWYKYQGSESTEFPLYASVCVELGIVYNRQNVDRCSHVIRRLNDRLQDIVINTAKLKIVKL